MKTLKSRGRRFVLPHDQPGKHESPGMFERRKARLDGIAKARKRKRTEIRDGVKFSVIRLPDNLGL